MLRLDAAFDSVDTLLMDETAIRERIEQIAIREMEIDVTAAYDVAFHMTDWLDDLKALNRFYENPTAMSDKEVQNILLQFLIHVPAHLAAACKLYTDLPVGDVFGIGATTEKMA